MKTPFPLLVLLVTTFTSYGQGTLIFNTRVPADNVNLRVYWMDGNPLTGPQFAAQLYGAPAGSSQSQLIPLGSPVQFRTGNAAGWIDAGVVTVTGVPGGVPATIQLRVWDTTTGSSYETSDCRVESFIWTTGALGDPTASPPTIPASLGPVSGGLHFLPWSCIPEPSPILFGMLGIGLFSLARRFF